MRRIACLNLSIVSNLACSQSGQVYDMPLSGQSIWTCVSFFFPLSIEVALLRRIGLIVDNEEEGGGGEGQGKYSCGM